MTLRKHGLCQHAELIQRLLDAADMIYLDPQADRGRLNRLLDLVERLQRRNPQTEPPRHYQHGSILRRESTPLHSSTTTQWPNCAGSVLPEQSVEIIDNRRRIARSSRS